MYTRGDREKLLAWEVPSISISLALLEAFCSPRCWNPPGRDAARSAQDLIPSPLGVISKLMLGSNGPDSLSPYLRARIGSPRLTPIVSNILRRITAHVKCNFGDPQYALR